MEKDISPFPGFKKFSEPDNQNNGKPASYTSLSIPEISLPKGGGAIKSIDEKFQVNAANGTAGFTIGFPFSPSRNGFMPSMALSYNSGAGNGIFGLGWNAEPASITRKTENKLPEYNDTEESDVFIFSGAEDLVPALTKVDDNWIKDESDDGLIKRYRPRIEGGFARIEKITETNGNVYWKVTSKDNIISVFGKSKSAQIFNPTNETKIFKWLLEFSCDDKGNCFQFEYKKEDKTNVPNELHEKNRLNDYSKFTNAYLKRIKYCNKIHFDRTSLNLTDWENFMNNIEYLLELVLDYGEHDIINPQPNDDNGWVCRRDAFSDYRAGFEIRTYRLCRRVLMFHRFKELGEEPSLIRSLDLEYDEGTAFTFLTSATQKGYIRRADNTYSQKSLPPLEFSYEPLGWNTEIKSLPKQSLENLPAGIDDQFYQWIDLYSEGISGILTEQANGWYYKSNLGDGNFAAIKLVSPKPSLNGLSTGAVHFQDIEANGQKSLVSNDLKGYFELTADDEWNPFKSFAQLPNIDIRNPNIKFLDLDGDGRSDMLISEDDVFVWYASKGKLGYDDYSLVKKSRDDEKGASIVFNDGTQSIIIADMSGDGLTDIVRIRNKEIVYWPNLGYGKFGAKVTMSNAPLFDNPDHFNSADLKLADLDGSGTTDIVYLGKDSFKIYFNQSGNSWSEENIIKGVNPIPFLKIDDHVNVNIIDLLGNGTGCIVWSSPLPKHTGNPLRYIDLMDGKKPHIMIGYRNNMGKEVNLFYKPSTYWYLEDKKAGNPWITKPPFPVQCVSQVEMIDQIRRSRFTNQYTYHHGYYDYYEREFRGFGRVDQTDTEDYENYKKHANPDGSIQIVDEGFHEPPVLTKTWFHTGAFIDKEKILTQFAHEYYQNAAVPENTLAEPALPDDLSIDEWREALRACKGMPLHVEVYSNDGSDKQDHPYTTAQHTCLIQLLQPKLDNEHAVFMVLESEALTYTYERNPADPRIAHSMNIEVDKFGNVLKAAAISYGRKTVDADLTESEQAEQSKTHIIFSENNYTNKINDASAYCLPLLYEAKTFELTGITPKTGDYFSIDEIKDDFFNAEEIAYEIVADEVSRQKRVIEHVFSVFLKDDLSGALPPGIIEPLVLPYQSYKLALTPGLIQYIYGDKVDEHLLITAGKYFQFEDGNYWIASGTQTYDAAHFYQVIEMIDPFGYKAQINYDDAYHLYVEKTTDALNNSSEILKLSFRTLSPYLMKDINDNRAGVRVDELGMLMSSFVMGKENEDKGDLFDVNAVEASTADKPGSMLEYDLFNYSTNGKPNYVKTTVNEIDYFYSIEKNKPIITQTSYTYYCGGGNEVMRKAQAEPGIALQENEDGTVTEVDTGSEIRWIGNGRTIINNKGKPVKQYEPYFSTTPDYEDSKLLVERGATPIIYYDSAGRVIKTEFPDGTFSKVEFDAWRQISFDAVDTVLESKWHVDRNSPQPTDSRPSDPQERAVWLSAIIADTPAKTYIDSLGRTFLAVQHNRTFKIDDVTKKAINIIDAFYKTRTELDIENNLRSITDARGNVVMQYEYDMLGNQLYSLSMDAGERWLVNDVMGKPMKSWDSRNHIFRYEYDQLHRPLKSYVAKGDGAEINFGKIVYGEGLANDKQLNLRGKLYQQFDAAGIVTNIQYDFKGNLLETSRQLCKEYRIDINWNTNPDLEDTFFSSTEYDALNRAVTVTAPDKSIITPSYNEANLLEMLEVQLKGAAEKKIFVKDINYNEKAQRESIIYGNDTKTNYTYDKNTFRLTQLITKQKDEPDAIQKLSYTYDAVGNITCIKDEAQQTIFFDNAIVEPSSDYVYDAIYQLIQASGREHVGQNQLPQDNWKDEYFTNLVHKGDGNAMRNYTQEYLYDEVGNFLKLVHTANSGSYTRTNTYQTGNNQIINSSVGANSNATIFSYRHDEHGNINQMPHLALMEWDFKDQLQCTQQTIAENGTGEKTYYVYDGSGQRIRKITERQGTENKKEERIYLGGFEIYRSYETGGTIELERETLHVMDDKQKIAMVDTITQSTSPSPLERVGVRFTRYQFTNHLGSACLELNENAEIVSYEEYHPYGTTAYQAMNKSINPVAKLYRYTGMERDEESGFEYHSARYYLPWLGRWLNADPISVSGGMNLFLYSSNNPNVLIDENGLAPRKPKPVSKYGDINPHNRQGSAIREDGVRLSENEHIRARINLVLQTRDPFTGLSPYDAAAYSRSTTLTIPEDMARIKTRMDMALRDRLKSALASGNIDQQLINDLSIEADIARTISARDQAILARSEGWVTLPTLDLESITDAKIALAAHLQDSELHHVGKIQKLPAGVTDSEVDHALAELDQHTTLSDTKPPEPVTKPQTDTPPSEPLPGESRFSLGWGTVIISTGYAAFQSDDVGSFLGNTAINIGASYEPGIGAVTAPDEGRALFAVAVGYACKSQPEACLAFMAPDIGLGMGNAMAKSIEQDHPGCGKNDSCPNRYMGFR